ncbi:MAG: LacI family transcriptional regulator [Glaciimonas sp.]|nr:LacI family transcriptional regulator [Glaciimonas sp.]
MATIKEVARLAEVSYTTVSHVLNNTRPVSDAARERVIKAVESLAYVPSALARSLKSNITGTIGLIIPNNTNPYFSEIARGIEDSCYAAGYSVILCNSDDDPEKQRAYLNMLLTKRCDGLIVAMLGDTDHDLLRKRKVPIVLLDRSRKNAAVALDIDSVVVDNVAGSVLAAEHLLKIGCKHIACIGGPEELAIIQARIAGMRRTIQNAMQKTGKDFPEMHCVYSDFTSAGGYAAASSLLGRSPRPDALFCCNDLMAIGALRAAAERGISVPEELAVVGFDDIALAQFVHPTLTSVSQHTRQLGQLTAQFLLTRIATPNCALQQKIIMPELHIRGSSVRSDST